MAPILSLRRREIFRDLDNIRTGIDVTNAACGIAAHDVPDSQRIEALELLVASLSKSHVPMERKLLAIAAEAVGWLEKLDDERAALGNVAA